MPLTLAIDGTNWTHQACHAAGPDDALPLAINRLKALLDFTQPAAAFACFDLGRCFRLDLHPGYKATRGTGDASIRQAVDRAPAAFGRVVDIAMARGFEADDCIATLASRHAAAGAKVVIASPDKDLRQCLVTGRVTILRSFKTLYGQLLEPVWMTAGYLEAETGLRPDQWPDFQALAGDSGDAVPGCRGWGPVTAARVLKAMGSLEACFADPWRVPCTPKQQAALRAFRDQAATMLKLVTLRTDVDTMEPM